MIDQAAARSKSGGCLIDLAAVLSKSSAAWLIRRVLDKIQAVAWLIRTPVCEKSTPELQKDGILGSPDPKICVSASFFEKVPLMFLKVIQSLDLSLSQQLSFAKKISKERCFGQQQKVLRPNKYLEILLNQFGA